MVGNILRRGSSFKSIGNSQKSESKPKKKKDKKKSTKKQKKKKKKKKDSSSESSHSLESSNSPSVSNSSDSSESKKKKKKKKSSGKDKKKKKKLSKKKFESESSSPESPNKIRKKALLRKISTVDHAILSKVMNRIDSEKELQLSDLESGDEALIEEMRKEFLKKKEQQKIDRKSKKQKKFMVDEDDISSSDCQDEAKKFKRMDYKSREQHLIFLWQRSFVKGRAGYRVLKWANDIRLKILRFGITGKKQIQDVESYMKIQWWILLPSSLAKTAWNCLMVILLLYTATYMPYKTCFIDEEDNPWLDYIIDILFTMDILVTFVSADTEEDGTLIHNQKVIAQNYLRGWFLFDFIAVAQSLLPFILTPELLAGDQTFSTEVQEPGALTEQQQADAEYQKLLRLLRIPRLYKMIRIFRIVKVLKISKNFKLLQKLKKKIKLNAAIMRMVQGVFTAVLFTHIFACIWFMSAKFSDFNEETWVYRKDLANSSPIEQYLVAMHWSTQTITTVGYGDVGAQTIPEIIISLFWMLFGVGFYSFIIGNFASIIQGNDQINASLEKRIRNLAHLTKQAQIPYELSRKIKTYIETNYESLYSVGDEAQLVKMLPPSLRDELLSFIYGKIVARIQFLKDCEDQDFLWHVLPILKSIHLQTDDVLYFRGDYAEDIYFIIQGTIKMYSEVGNCFHKVSNGQMLGESDTLLDLPRISKASAVMNINLMALSKSQFETLFQYCQDYCFKMIMDAKAKRDFLIQKMNRVDEKIQLKKEIKEREEKRKEIEMMEKVSSRNKSKFQPINETPERTYEDENSAVSTFSHNPIGVLKQKFNAGFSSQTKTLDKKFADMNSKSRESIQFGSQESGTQSIVHVQDQQQNGISPKVISESPSKYTLPLNTTIDASPRFAIPETQQPETPFNTNRHMDQSEFKTPKKEESSPKAIEQKVEPQTAIKLQSQKDSSNGTISDQSACSLMVKKSGPKGPKRRISMAHKSRGSTSNVLALRKASVKDDTKPQSPAVLSRASSQHSAFSGASGAPRPQKSIPQSGIPVSPKDAQRQKAVRKLSNVLKQMEAPIQKKVDPTEAEKPKQESIPIAVQDVQQSEPVKEAESPKKEEVKAPEEPIPEAQSPDKNGSFSDFVQKKEQNPSLGQQAPITNALQINKIPQQKIDANNIPPTPAPGGNKRSGPMKRMSMRIGQPPGGKGPSGPLGQKPNEQLAPKKSLLPARRLSTSRTLAQKVIEKTFGTENKEKIFQQYPQLQKLNEDKGLKIEQAKGAGILKEEDEIPESSPNVGYLQRKNSVVKGTGQGQNPSPRRPPASRQSSVFGGAPKPMAPMALSSLQRANSISSAGQKEGGEEDQPKPVEKKESQQRLSRSQSIAEVPHELVQDFGNNFNNTMPKQQQAPQQPRLPPAFTKNEDGTGTHTPGDLSRKQSLNLRPKLDAPAAVAGGPRSAPKTRMSMRAPPGKRQQSSMMLKGVKKGVKSAMEKALEEKKKFQQELAQKQQKMQNSAEQDIESMQSKKQVQTTQKPDNLPQMNMPPKACNELKGGPAPPMNKKKSSRMSMLRKVNTTEFNDADTELNFLREAVDNNLERNELKEKLESKFKIQTNMFSDVVRNLGGIVQKSVIETTTNDEPKNEIDSILQNIEKQHGKIQDFETEMQRPIEMIQRQFISQNTLEKIRHQLLLKEYLQTKALVNDNKKKKKKQLQKTGTIESIDATKIVSKEIMAPLSTKLSRKTSIIKISGMNPRDLSNIEKKQQSGSIDKSQVIIKSQQTNIRVNPILELRIKGANVAEEQDDGDSSHSQSVVSKIDYEEDEFKDRVTEIIENTFNTSSKYNKYKINTHDFLMNQLSDIMNQHHAGVEFTKDDGKKTPCTQQKGVQVDSIIQKRVRESTNNLNFAPKNSPKKAVEVSSCYTGHANLLEIVKFNKDANLVALNVFEILTAAKTYKKQRDLLFQRKKNEDGYGLFNHAKMVQDDILESQDTILRDMQRIKDEVRELNQLKKDTYKLSRPVLPINEEFARKERKNLKKERSLLKLEKRIFSKTISDAQ